MRSSLLLAFSLLLAGAADAQDLNVITGVEVRNEGNSVVVTVKGSKPPNFTTFSMADPARFVIDLSEAKFQGVPEDLRVDDGVIRVIKNLAYGSGASAIARVMLAFSLDVDPPDVQTDGTSLVVKVIKPGAPAVAATAARPADAATPAAPPAVAAAASDAAAVAAATAAAAARAEADAVARQEALAREQRETEAREQARLAAESSAKERETQARLEAEAVAREAEKVAAEQAAADRAASAAAEARRAEIRAKVAAEEGQAQQAAEDQARAEAKARQEVEEALAAQQAAEARAVAAAAPTSPPPVAAPIPPPAAAPVVAPVAAAPVTAPVTARLETPAATPARPAKLQAVGFTQLPTVSRVFVKTSATPRFTITDVGDDVVRLEVENTRASRRNDTRPLDTSFFPSAVALITPSKQGTSYVVDIKLKKRVPYQQKVEGDVLAIDFERPPSEAGAPAAPGQATLENQQGLVLDPEGKADGAEPVEPEPATEPAPKQ